MLRHQGARKESRPRHAVGFAALLVAIALAPTTTWSKDRAGGALDLHDMGTFYVGGRIVESPTPASSGPPFILPPARGSRAVDQSFVAYFVPRKVRGAPLVMVPGGSLLGSQYQTTPDGRPGSERATRFVQWGHPTYLLEPANRGRAGLYAAGRQCRAAGQRRVARAGRELVELHSGGRLAAVRPRHGDAGFDESLRARDLRCACGQGGSRSPACSSWWPRSCRTGSAMRPPRSAASPRCSNAWAPQC